MRWYFAVFLLNGALLFSFANSNIASVDAVFDALSALGQASGDLASIISAIGAESEAVQDASLNQLHPAFASDFAEEQFQIGGQLLSLFHRKPRLPCGCSREKRLWVEPFGNWLHLKNHGAQVGFQATTRGLAFGVDFEFLNAWTFGLGGAWNQTDLRFASGMGYAYTDGLYGALYTDISFENFYVGGSFYAGRDWYTTARKIFFLTIDRQATSHFHGLDLAGQLTAAYYFGSPVCFLYPYATLDYLYLQTNAFSEQGASSLDLEVNRYQSSTLRTEAGLGLEMIDRNYRETICVSPRMSIGWVMEAPLHRDPLTATFTGTSLPFSAQGWDQTRQLLNFHFGLGLSLKCLLIDGEYIIDTSTGGGSPYFNQRANFLLQLSL